MPQKDQPHSLRDVIYECFLFQVRLSVRSGVTRPDEVRVTTDVDLWSPILLVNTKYYACVFIVNAFF